MCFLGVLLPYSAFMPWLVENGVNLGILLMEIMESKISLFAWLDVIISAVVLLVFIWVEGKRTKISNLWLPTIATIAVGVSLGLPLFLFMREIHFERLKKNNRQEANALFNVTKSN